MLRHHFRGDATARLLNNRWMCWLYRHIRHYVLPEAELLLWFIFNLNVINLIKLGRANPALRPFKFLNIYFQWLSLYYGFAHCPRHHTWPWFARRWREPGFLNLIDFLFLQSFYSFGISKRCNASNRRYFTIRRNIGHLWRRIVVLESWWCFPAMVLTCVSKYRRLERTLRGHLTIITDYSNLPRPA